MSYRAEISVDEKQLAEINNVLDKIRDHSEKAGRATVQIMAERYAKDIKAWYGVGIPPKLTQATLQKREQGKRSGRTPAIPPYPGNRPLSRSGKLMSLVRLGAATSSRTATYRVFIQPGVPLPGGGISDKVARVHEEGREYSFIATKAVRIYLRALALGIAGTDENLRPEDMPRGGSIQITVRIPARPIWLPVFKTLLSQQPFGQNGFARIFTQEFIKRTKLPIKFE